MSLVDEFADFVGSVPTRELALPRGAAHVWDLGSGSPVVLLHGIAGARRIFFRVVPLLARDRRVIVPLLRGEDEAVRERAPGPYLDDVGALLEGLDLSDVTLLGVSFGGYLALAYAARGDPRVARAVVQGGFARYRLRLADRVALRLSYLGPDALGAAYFRRRVLKGRESSLVARHCPGLETLVADWMGKTPFSSLRARTYMISRHDAFERMETPITIAHGRLDSVVRFDHFERLRDRAPRAEAVVWDDAGHNVALTHPERLVELVATSRARS